MDRAEYFSGACYRLLSSDWWKFLINQSAGTKLRKRHRTIMPLPIIESRSLIHRQFCEYRILKKMRKGRQFERIRNVTNNNISPQ